MELDGIKLSEISQSEKDRHIMVSFIWRVWKLVNGIKGKVRKWVKISVMVTKHERLGKGTSVVEREVGGEFWGDRVMGTEEGTSWDEHWVLWYMLTNWTPIKKRLKNHYLQLPLYFYPSTANWICPLISFSLLIQLKNQGLLSSQ